MGAVDHSYFQCKRSKFIREQKVIKNELASEEKNPPTMLFPAQVVELSSRFVTVDSCSTVKKCLYGASIQKFAAFFYSLFALVSFPMHK